MKTDARSLSVDFSIHEQQGRATTAARTVPETSFVNYIPKQMKSGSSFNSLKSSGAEMSLSTSNIGWQWCRNIGRLQSNCISQAFPNESMKPRITWNTKRHGQLSISFYLCIYSQYLFIFYVFSGVVAAGSWSRSSECAEGSLVHYIYQQVIQQSESEAEICSVFTTIDPAPQDSKLQG